MAPAWDSTDAGAPPRLADLSGAGARLAAWCEICGRHRLLPVALLVRRLGPGTALAEVARRLRCSACGSRSIQVRPHYRGLGVVAGHEKSGPLSDEPPAAGRRRR